MSATITSVQVMPSAPAMVAPPPRKRHTDKERREIIEQMVEERIREESTDEQIAARHNICSRTLRRWKQSDEWREVEHRWRRILREETRSDIAEIASKAVGVLTELALNDKVQPFTRMNAAKTLLEFSGVADELEEIKVDQNDELLTFLKQAKASRSVVATVMDIEPLPSGLLPPELSGQYTPSEPEAGSLDSGEVGDGADAQEAVGGSDLETGS